MNTKETPLWGGEDVPLEENPLVPGSKADRELTQKESEKLPPPLNGTPLQGSMHIPPDENPLVPGSMASADYGKRDAR